MRRIIVSLKGQHIFDTDTFVRFRLLQSVHLPYSKTKWFNKLENDSKSVMRLFGVVTHRTLRRDLAFRATRQKPSRKPQKKSSYTNGYGS